MKSHKNKHEFRITLSTQTLACWLGQAEWYCKLWVLVAANLSVIRTRRCMQITAISLYCHFNITQPYIRFGRRSVSEAF